MWRLFQNWPRVLTLAILPAVMGALSTHAQTPGETVPDPSKSVRPGWPSPTDDNRLFTYFIFNQLEGRTNGSEATFRWDGQGWIGTDYNKLWLKSEGRVTSGKMSDGDHELLYDRPIPHLRYLD